MLGVVVVSVAVAVGIQAFADGRGRADRDALVLDAMRVVTDLQAWKLKPDVAGGGAGADGFTGASFRQAGADVGAGGFYATPTGCLSMGPGSATGVTLTLRPKVAGVCAASSPVVGAVRVSGPAASDIAWAYP